MLSMLRDCELHLCGCTTCAASTAKRRVDFFGHNRVACTDGLLSFRCLLRDVAVHLLCLGSDSGDYAVNLILVLVTIIARCAAASGSCSGTSGGTRASTDGRPNNRAERDRQTEGKEGSRQANNRTNHATSDGTSRA